MGRDIAAAFAPAREVFQEVDDTLGQKLSKLMFEGPGEDLILTENDNGGGQVVISGDRAAVEPAVNIAKRSTSPRRAACAGRCCWPSPRPSIAR